MKNRIKIFCIFLCCLIISLLFIFVYSKYNSDTLLKINTEIAEPIFKIKQGGEEKIISVLNNDKYFYEFSVKNFNEEDKFSNVKLKYSMEFVLSQENAPVIINLYKINGGNEEKIELNNMKTVRI